MEIITQMEKPSVIVADISPYILDGTAARRSKMPNKPIIVCLCGSTRFKDEFVAANLRETLAGKIVLSIGCDMRTDAEIFGMLSPDQETWPEETKDIKKRLDELHFRKIELADEVLILNKNGYIGYSTRNELNHAKRLGKVIRYLEEVKDEG